MCCFAGPVTDVSSTNIFARVSGDREHLVYEMTFSSDDQTAMILPIPAASAAADEAVEFVALDNYPDFFRDLERHFSAASVGLYQGRQTTTRIPQGPPRGRV